MVVMDFADKHLRADLEERELRGFDRVKYWAGVALAVFTHEAPPIYDLVVKRIDGGATVMRTPADLGDPEVLLDQVRLDLEEKTVSEFFAEWRIDQQA